MEFRILGPLQVLEGGSAVPISSRKQRALLAILLLHAGAVVSRDRLIDALWEGEPPATAASALRVHVAELRKAIEASAPARQMLLTVDPGYRLDLEGEQLDLARFERLLDTAGTALGEGDAGAATGLLHEALELWRGPALADFTYESFARQAIGRLEELRLVALERRFEAELALGRDAVLGPELGQLVGEHPLRERPRGQLMLALYRSGRQADALATFQQARRRMADELGIEPGQALQTLEQQILNQDRSLDANAPAGAAAPTAGAPAAAAADVAPETPDRSVLLFGQAQDALDALIGLGTALAQKPPRELILVRAVDAEEDLIEATTALAGRRGKITARGQAARTAAFNSATPGHDVVRLASEQDTDLLLRHADDSLLASGTIGGDVQLVLETASCDVGLVASGGDLDRERPVMVPLGGAEHEWAAVEVGAWAARALAVPLMLLGSSGDGDTDASRLLAHASLATPKGLGVDASPMLVEPGDRGVLEAASRSSLLVIGLSDRWRQDGLGATRHAVARDAQVPVLIVRRGLRPGGLAPRHSLTRFTWALSGRRG
ncbi:MAG: BTAD domain-containing putative transcriptional regulator [Gaiellales bacterium]